MSHIKDRLKQYSDKYSDEINEDYYNDARKRLEEFRSQITLFDLGMEEHK